MGTSGIDAAAPDVDGWQEGEARSVRAFYEAVKARSHPNGTLVKVRIHDSGWDVYDSPPALPAAPNDGGGE